MNPNHLVMPPASDIRDPNMRMVTAPIRVLISKEKKPRTGAVEAVSLMF